MKNRFGDLKMQTLRLFSDFESTHHNKTSDAVHDLISKVRDSLSLPGQPPGVWETAELDDAAHALDAGFPKLALISAGKAIAVHQLSKAEYTFGFGFVRRQEGLLAERNSACAEVETLCADAAHELLTVQKEAADTLARMEKEEAKTLKSAEELTARALANSQHHAARALRKEDTHAAVALENAQKVIMDELSGSKNPRTSPLQEEEQVMSWMSGGYSIEHVRAHEDGYSEATAAQETTALALIGRQDQTAAELKETQTEEAAGLKETEKLGAEELKAEQQHAAARLRETQMIQAQNKKSSHKPCKTE